MRWWNRDSCEIPGGSNTIIKTGRRWVNDMEIQVNNFRETSAVAQVPSVKPCVTAAHMLSVPGFRTNEAIINGIRFVEGCLAVGRPRQV